MKWKTKQSHIQCEKFAKLLNITEEHTALLFVWIEVQGLPNRVDIFTLSSSLYKSLPIYC